MAQDTAAVGARVTRGAAYMIASRFIIRGIGLFSTLILVRLLQPQDFGLVALASAVYAMLAMLTSTGFNMALVRMREPAREHYDTAWTMTVIRGAVIAAGLIATADLQADFMGDPRIAGLMWVLALNTFVSGFDNIALVKFQRELKFEKLMRYVVMQKISSFVVAMPLAFILQNYWALVLGNLAARFIYIPYGFYLRPYRPRFTLKAWRDLFNFSKWVALGNVIGVLDTQVMNFAIGRFVGLDAVGAFAVGYQIAALPASEIASPARDPAFAGLSLLQDDRERAARNFISGTAMLLAVVLPLSVGIALTATPLTAVALGEKWAFLAPVLPLFALYAFCDAVTTTATMVFWAFGRQRLLLAVLSGTIVLRVGFAIIGALHDALYGAAAGMTLSSVINLVVFYLLVRPVVGFRWAALWSANWRTLVAGALMTAVVWPLSYWMGGLAAPPGAWVTLLTLSALGAIIHIGTQWSLWAAVGKPNGAERRILDSATGWIAKLDLRRRRARVATGAD